MKVTIAEIAKRANKDRSSVLRRCKREGWIAEKEKNRLVFSLENLPEDIRQLFMEQERRDPAYTKRSIILLGKQGIGKTYTLQKLVAELSKSSPVIAFTEPPTAKTILLNLAMQAGIKEDTKEKLFEALRSYSGKTIYLAIDSLEYITPSAIEVLGQLMDFKWFRFIGAGHLGGKKKFNHVWMKAKAIFIKGLSRQEANNLITSVWPEADQNSRRIILDTAKGVPAMVLKMAMEGKQGILPEETARYFDFTPVILVIATIGLAVRILGYGYQSAESYIIGGIIAAVFWGLFWIYRGYVAGWWGTKPE
jgi:hypothetical protein